MESIRVFFRHAVFTNPKQSPGMFLKPCKQWDFTYHSLNWWVDPGFQPTINSSGSRSTAGCLRLFSSLGECEEETFRVLERLYQGGEATKNRTLWVPTAQHQLHRLCSPGKWRFWKKPEGWKFASDDDFPFCNWGWWWFWGVPSCVFFHGKNLRSTRRCGTTMIVPRNPWNCHLPGGPGQRRGGCHAWGFFIQGSVWMDQGLVIQWCFFVPNININIMDVSENRGFSPQIIHFHKVFHYKPTI